MKKYIHIRITAIVNKVEEKGNEKLVLLDVTYLSLGIDKGNGIMKIIITRNIIIPFEKKLL